MQVRIQGVMSHLSNTPRSAAAAVAVPWRWRGGTAAVGTGAAQPFVALATAPPDKRFHICGNHRRGKKVYLLVGCCLQGVNTAGAHPLVRRAGRDWRADGSPVCRVIGIFYTLRCPWHGRHHRITGDTSRLLLASTASTSGGVVHARSNENCTKCGGIPPGRKDIEACAGSSASCRQQWLEQQRKDINNHLYNRRL